MSIVSGVQVRNAKTLSYFEGTPTYGSQPVHALDLRVSVNDAEVQKQHGYDGFERPFAMIPRKVDGNIVWEKHALEFAGHGRAGYFGDQRTDEYVLPRGLKIDAATVKSLGVAVGMDTNAGQVWAQRPGDNADVVDWK